MADVTTPTVDPAKPAPAASIAPSSSEAGDLVPLHEMTRAELKAAREKPGTYPRRKREEPKVDATPDAKSTDSKTPASKPAQPVDQAAPTGADQTPASEPGQPTVEKGAKPKGEALKARNEELERENQRLAENLKIHRQLRDATRKVERDGAEPAKPDVKPVSSPAAETGEVAWKRYRAMPDAPKEDAFDKFEDFTAAMSLFIADKRFEERIADYDTRSRTSRHHEQAFEQQHGQYVQRLRTHFEAHPEAKGRVNQNFMRIVPSSQLAEGDEEGPHNFIAQQVFESELPGPLAEYFSADEGTAQFAKMMRMNKAQILREFGALEARLATKTGPTPAVEEEPPTKTVSEAPEPPVTNLGRRPSAPGDPMLAAIASKDMRAFRQAYNEAHATTR